MSERNGKKQAWLFFLNVSWHHLFIKVMHNLPTWSLYSILYVELHDIIRVSGSQISIAISSRKKQQFCQELIQKEHDRSLWERREEGKIPNGRWGSMAYRVWERINKHESHWAVRKRWRMTPISVHREKKGKGGGGNHTQRRRWADKRQNYPHNKEEEEGVGRRRHRNVTGPDQSLQTLHSS